MGAEPRISTYSLRSRLTPFVLRTGTRLAWRDACATALRFCICDVREMAAYCIGHVLPAGITKRGALAVDFVDSAI
jgi:hypothetical protein